MKTRCGECEAMVCEHVTEILINLNEQVKNLTAENPGYPLTAAEIACDAHWERNW